MRLMIVCVLGMHRSGTSAVAGILHRSGIAMGSAATFFPRASQENPKGFYEDWRFRAINDLALLWNGYRVKSYGPPVPATRCPQPLRLGMHRLLRSRRARWGWKDPRQMLTLASWLPQLSHADIAPRLRCVVIYRRPDAVARSLLTRGNVASVAHGIELWNRYHAIMIQSGFDRHLETAAFRYEDLVAGDEEVVSSLTRFVDTDLTDAARTFIDPSLNRSGLGPGMKSDLSSADPEVAAWLEAHT